MQIIKDIFLDFYDQNFVRVNAKQGDTARYVRVEIIQDNVIFSIPTDATASIACGDVWNVCTITENKILAPLKGLLDKPGEKRCQIELLLGSDKLTTTSFNLNVEATARNDGAIEGSNELSVLDQAVANANKAATEATDITEEIRRRLDNGDFVGSPGEPGTAATIKINSVTTGEPGTDAIIENVGTSTDVLLNITIPQGPQGPPGSNENFEPITNEQIDVICV